MKKKCTVILLFVILATFHVETVEELKAGEQATMDPAPDDRVILPAGVYNRFLASEALLKDTEALNKLLADQISDYEELLAWADDILLGDYPEMKKGVAELITQYEMQIEDLNKQLSLLDSRCQQENAIADKYEEGYIRYKDKWEKTYRMLKLTAWAVAGGVIIGGVAGYFLPH